MKKSLSKSEIKELNAKIESQLGFSEFLDKKDKVEVVDDKFIFVNNECVLFYHEGRILPHLKTLLKDNFLKKAVVDMNAVPFVVKGADIMRPGIKEMEEFPKDSAVVIVDLNNRKPLAIGIALFSSEEMKAMDKGKVIKNIHYVGDEVWNK